MLERDFYLRDANRVAKDLIGKILVHRAPAGLFSGRIVETEAYIGAVDKASHAYPNKRTARTEVMYREGGCAYVYLIYGMHHCFNIVTAKEGKAEAVLIRALEPLCGFSNAPARCLSGPGKLCRGLDITREHNGADLCGNVLYIEDDGALAPEILETKRINIDYAEEAKDFLWRYTAKNSKFLSK